MFRYVRNPQPVWRIPGEHALHQIGRGRRLVTWPGPAITRQALDARAGHQQLDLVVADLQPQPEGEFGVDPHDAVGAARGGVHGADLFGQPGMANIPGRRWTTSPLVVADWATDSSRHAICTGNPSAAMVAMAAYRLLGRSAPAAVHGPF